ncbi:extracellular solute-binding protein [Paenibacillus algorifonticola]|uniref:Extracellular solute-binding protein n=1 Tax=Paenibacillus algorifonticola TaxID=684063 RepID=A0A1I1YMY4_9BACL|nr:extracellular solute-binding protein [Paenibacillus algorifonticola]SFE20662.1 extracellular solute-binding protein [Paenibacillus algorifonticola]
MNRRLLHITKLAGLTLVVAVTAFTAVSDASANMSSPWTDDTASENNTARSHVSVSFQNTPVSLPLPPKMLDGTIMVPGKAVLEGLGYTITWHAAGKQLTAEHPSKPRLVFWADRKEAELGGKPLSPLKTAPYLDQKMIWLPLRLVAEASGLSVTWDAFNRTAFVSDPQALPQFSVMTRPNDGTVAPPTPLLKYMQENMNVDVRLQLADPELYKQKTAVMFAAGQPASIMLLEDPYQYNDELLESLAVDLTKQLEAFPRLKALSGNNAWGGRVIDGKLYGIARPGDHHDAPFPAIRQDWLDKLNLAQPKTMDELYEVLKQFTFSDPDGNGKQDTIGLSGYTYDAGLGTLSWVEHAFTESPDRFSIKEGKLIDHAVQPEQALALKWLARAYRDGLVDKEFAVRTGEQTKVRLSENLTGLAAMSVTEAAQLSTGQAVWVPLSGIQATTSSPMIAPWKLEGNGMYIISRMSRTDPELMLNWLNRGYEMTEKNEWGAIAELGAADYSAINHLFGQTDMLKGNQSVAALPANLQSAYEAAVSEWSKTSYADTTLPQLNSFWNQGKYADLNSKLVQFKIKVILGAATIEEWERYVASLVANEEYKLMIADIHMHITARAK